MKRRIFLKTATGLTGLAASGLAGSAFSKSLEASSLETKTGFSLALGGGAAKAFAHIPILEAIDELGVTPAEISGTSMGAILGGLYASGMSGKEIRTFTVDLFTQKTQLFQKLFLKDGRTWGSLLNVMRPAIIDPVVLFETILPQSLAPDFKTLRIPLKIVATDFYTQDLIVLTDGQLLPAIAASSALPMLLTPVKIEGKVLIDGGFVDPTPFAILDAGQHHTVAVDVTGSDFLDDGKLPSGMETWIGSFSITLHSLVQAKLACSRPDILVEPPIGRFTAMDFFKVRDILAAADRSKDPFKRDLERLLT
ncbi:patatin-like phospholipase family protein [Roseibium denhamense]|uniref:NTE family protein n=1 Tax=Roseibium denhamense TaxID=76305 RepID=A0ABY1NPW2_9HYPH|nr:patatin-like phospholipase family protein [Roseibium denhamense]MTI07949.1 patatin-like phospholipase family protein [Roseibium denhamense]SMP15101.1 NTE family protein [Roseibium denhamense]